MNVKNTVLTIGATATMLVAMVMLHACSHSASTSPKASSAPAAEGQLLFEQDLSTGTEKQAELVRLIAPGTGYVMHADPTGAPPPPSSAARGRAVPGGTFAGARTAESAAPSTPASNNRSLLTKADALDAGAAEGERAAARRVPDLITRIRPGEELWVIAEATEFEDKPGADDAPGCGALVTTLPGRDGFVPVPLEHTGVTGHISGYIASVDVAQRFHNPYDTKIEAVYVFPLPENAAVRDFLMTIGDRTIRGVIREREEAQRIYDAAKARGHVASLMSQERPNIFTQKVANIEPGKRIDVTITYFNTLAYSDGWFEFVFPMVVGPRFNPGPTAGAGAGVGAVPRDEVGASGQAVEVAYLRPTERSGHDISVDLRIDAGVSIEEVRSATHRIDVDREGDSVRRVRLARSDTVPNRDLVVRYRVAGDTVKSALFTHIGRDGAGYFTMMLVPPQLPASMDRAPVEFVFVIDSSGSMNGEPIRLAKEAVRTALDALRPDDSFQIIDFSDSVSHLGSRPLAATPENIRRGRKHLDSMGAGGGTHMMLGIQAALRFPMDEARSRFVVFLTDGYIGNESQILAEIDREIGDARIFSFGIGSSVNRHLLDEMARTGRGAVAYIGLRDRARDVMGMFFERVSRPALRDVRIDLGSMAGAEMYPERIPDLFVGRPVVITGRYDAARAGVGTSSGVRVVGNAGGRRVTMDVATESRGADRTGALEAIWARAKIASLTNASLRGDPHGELTGAIRHTALAHGLLSQFTSFLAVDSMVITEGDRGVTVPVPVPVPQGVEYSTTVGSTGDR
jgi:Ca-activated chloride channel family protein